MVAPKNLIFFFLYYGGVVESWIWVFNNRLLYFVTCEIYFHRRNVLWWSELIKKKVTFLGSFAGCYYDFFNPLAPSLKRMRTNRFWKMVICSVCEKNWNFSKVLKKKVTEYSVIKFYVDDKMKKKSSKILIKLCKNFFFFNFLRNW